ncbi:aa3-type cytochrome c oxidase subunit IV [Paracoccus hibiscisoli]|uniref:Aa3-type cytochrome c oxidase subunit IV n=1 Tax=Paracoccus hibiscisoli TaxID=2023261 RepID=A0A4U0QWE2_9RHOB|nr:aa3-type cytochrome c oxidase subunit IV [Paracoccus hibiscisoli]TJZ86561.1 aa3-type cytochrome c oxidase subunit IV [Paracoccus hibiscisoli]
MADYDNKPEATQGSMDLSEHKKTFSGFIRASVWITGLSLGVLVFLALVNG